MSTADLRVRRGMKKAFQFNMIVVGASGLGKSTFINTLCGSRVIPRKSFEDPSKCSIEKTIQITPYSVEIDEEGIKMQLTIVDTPGFGDNIDNTSTFNEILAYIERQYDDVLAEESKIKRNPKFQDNRIHVLLYFIQPTGHALREIDIELMKRLATRVNIIPVIGKADTMTHSERKQFKHRSMEDIQHHGIPIYDFPFDETEEDEESAEENLELRSLLPFAIVGSDEEFTVNGRTLRARQYPWGLVEVDNLLHCDYARLRNVLLSSHLQDLKEITHDHLYEAYRSEKLSKLEGLAEKLAELHVQDSPVE